MVARLPPLTALRAFEAAARHMSFAQAAAELFVTPAALSYQIKSLETELGQPLFRRLNRAVELTEAGRILAPRASEGFDTLAEAWRQVSRLQTNSVLTVTAGPAFTSKWLAPRMYDFAKTHPDIELRFSATLRILDFARDDVDVAIRFGMGQDKGVYSRPLVREWMTPMMAPALAKQITRAEDLNSAPLIHDDSVAFLDPPANWAAWCRAAGVTIATDSGPRFSQGDHALDAAIAGAGVVLGRVSLASRALASGQLVAPFETGLIAAAQFRFICPEAIRSRPQVKAFEEWIAAEMAVANTFDDGRVLVHSADVASM